MKNEPNRKRHGDHNRHTKPQPVPQKFDGCRKHAVSDKDTRADRDARCRAHKHTCRRNIDMVAIIMNNRIYGMTGGQFSPLSGRGIRATTARRKAGSA